MSIDLLAERDIVVDEASNNTYSTQSNNRQSVEAVEFGTFKISFTKARADWLEEAYAEGLRGEIEKIIEAVKEVIPGCQTLRLVTVSSDFGDEYQKWKREIGWEEVVPLVPALEFWGKALVWGDGKSETTWAILILPEFTADALKSSQGDLRYGSCRLVHDLAHIHSEALYLRFRRRLQPIQSNDWPHLGHHYAYLIWSEYFAEVIACRYSSQCCLFNEHSLRGTIFGLKRSLELIPLLLEGHRDAKDVYWGSIFGALDALFASLGRILGNLQGGEEHGVRLLDTFLDQLSQEDVGWGKIARQLQEECHQILDKDWEPALLGGLENAVLDALITCGIHKNDGVL